MYSHSVLVNYAVGIEIGDAEPAVRRPLGELSLRERAVLVGIRGRPHLVRRRQRNLPAGIALGRAVSIDKDDVAGDYRRGLDFPREPAHPPELGAVRGIVRGQQERAWQQDLIAPVRSAPDDRRRVTAGRFGPRRLPALLAGFLVHGEQMRSAALIDREQQQVVVDHRRRAHAVDVVERTERQLPELLAGQVVRDEAVVGEEHVERVRFHRDRRRRRIVALVDRRPRLRRRCAFPDRLSRRAIERHRHQRLLPHAGQIDAIAEQDRRRVPERQLHAPQQVLLRPELGRHILRGRNAAAVGPAEANPVGSGLLCRERRGKAAAERMSSRHTEVTTRRDEAGGRMHERVARR